MNRTFWYASMKHSHFTNSPDSWRVSHDRPWARAFCRPPPYRKVSATLPMCGSALLRTATAGGQIGRFISFDELSFHVQILLRPYVFRGMLLGRVSQCS